MTLFTSRQASHGFTLVELLVVMAIAAILAAMAGPAFTEMIARQRTKAAATDLYLSMNKARSEAIKRNANITINPVGGNWQAGWQVTDTGGVALENHGAVTNLTITGSASIVYQGSGRIQGTTAPSLVVTSTTYSSIYRTVSAELSGRPYVQASP